MAEKTKYCIGDKLSCVDLNGKVYRIIIQSISTYDVARQFGSLEILAQQYPSPNDTIKKDTRFYICSSLSDEGSEPSATLNNIIIWDDVIDHDRTEYITAKSVFRLDILPYLPRYSISFINVSSSCFLVDTSSFISDITV